MLDDVIAAECPKEYLYPYHIAGPKVHVKSRYHRGACPRKGWRSVLASVILVRISNHVHTVLYSSRRLQCSVWRHPSRVGPVIEGEALPPANGV